MEFKDPHSYTDLSQGKIKHIDFQTRIDFVTKVFQTEAQYQLEGPVTGSFYLDAAQIDLKRAAVDGRDLPWEFDEKNELLGERLHLKGLEDTSSLTLTFTTSPEAGALQWLDGPKTLGGEHPFLYSQCQAIHARSLFPCQDSPSVRFTYSAKVEVPKALTAVMAAEQVGVEERGESRVFHFKMPQPIPSYLFAIAAGHLVFRELGPRTGVYAEPGIVETAAWEFAENEAKIVEAEKLLGPYLWGRYDLLVLPPTFPYGGMENPRLTFLTPTAILGNRGQTALITHELAHAWTGNLVTNATWEDFWLNEGWTTYAETRITEVLEGKDVADLMAVYDDKRLLEVMERFGMDSPRNRLKLKLSNIDPDEATTIIPYYKGCFFIKECEYVVGRERFDAFIQKYTGSFQFQSLTTEAFIEFLRNELPEVFEKVDVREWIYEPGIPAERSLPTSRLYEEVQAALRAYENGKFPTAAQVDGWQRYQMLAFLQGLPKKMPAEDCRHFDELLDLENRNDAAYQSQFYETCILSGYQEILPRVEDFVSKIGRMLYLLPIFRAMTQAEWAHEHARRILEQTQPHQHQITVKVIDQFLNKAGL